MTSFLSRLVQRHFDYTARFHFKRRVNQVDYRFLGAVLLLGAMLTAAILLF
ncbi:hypothetical protein SH591_06845 [Sphingomonas sp. LY54]|uniref:hypothetical protein n=1 Tax=Sphingomonas sp. LY54 TaxID=3095343 RepID=UPI002D78E3BA|nr:hypothetical protein [Sphingomonas sp. LY54]WRP29890.1 hypothetical protein SH591_06845 [Sphingomonas sp. LY54]